MIEGVDEEVARDDDGLPYPGDGPMVGSGRFDGKGNREAYAEIVEWLASEGRGEPSVNYRLRDWLVSRQRYWGAPIPIVYCDRSAGSSRSPTTSSRSSCPRSTTTRPQGKSPLAAAEDWVATECPKCGGPARRETDTMDTFVDSSWYFIRYLDPRNDERPWDRAAADHWLPVDQYIGGVEHAILHLMYARFFTKALADLGELEVQEPFANLFAQGMITRDGAKMSKSRGNTVAPSEYVERYGADTARTYVCFMGPPERGGDWTDEGVEGVGRFLARLWRLCEEVEERASGEGSAAGASESAEVRDLIAKAHWAIDKVTRDFERGFQFNTVIAAVMELVNDAYRLKDDLFEGADGQAAAALRDGDRRLADLPLRPAPRGRGLGAAERRPGLGGALAEGRPGDARPRHRDPRRPGQRQAPRPDRGRRRHPRGRAAGAGAGERERQPPPRRQGDRQGDRRARQARQSGGSLIFPGPDREFLVQSPPMLVRRLADAPVEELHRLRSHVLMDAGELGSRNMSVTWLEVPAGAEQTLRSHEEAEQVYVVVRGAGTMSVAGDTQQSSRKAT